MGVARIFQMGVTLGQSEGTHQIVMSLSPPAISCLPKKGLQKGGGGSWAPQDPTNNVPDQ